MNKWYYIFIPALALTTFALTYLKIIPYYFKDKIRGGGATNYGGWVR